MRLVKALCLLLYLEGGALVLLGLGYGGYSLSRTGNHAPAVLAGVAAVAAGLGLLALGRAVSRGRSWSRSPAVVVNLLLLPLAWNAFRGGAWWAGVALAGLSLAVLYLFATPELREALRD